MILACLLATLATAFQDAPHEATIPERLAALIAKTNAQEGFVARYHLRNKEDRESDLRIAFRSPGELVFDVQFAEGRACMRVRDGAMVEIHGEQGSRPVRSSCEDWSPETGYTRALRQLFEKQLPGVLRPDELRPADKLLVALRCDSEGYSFDTGLGTDRSARLAWLEDMQRAPERVRAGAGNELVFALAEKVQLFVSSESGFPTRLEKQTEKGTRVGAELVSLETAKPPEDAQFELPGFGEAPRDGSDELELSMCARGFQSSRAALFGALARALDDERLQWSEELQPRLEALLKDMREIDFAPFSAALGRHRLAWVEQAAGPYAEQIGKLDLSDAQVKAGAAAQLAGNRSSLERSMGAELEREMAREFARAPCKRRPALRDDLLEIEKRVLPPIHARECSEPVLAAFDEKIGKLVEAK